MKNNSKTKIPTRNEVDDQYKWSLKDMITNPTQWQSIYDQCTKSIKKIATYQHRICESSTTLYSCLTLRDDLFIQFETLYVYSNMNFHEDTTNNDMQILVQKANTLKAKVEEATSFIEPEILEKELTDIEFFISQEPQLKVYTHYFNDLFRKKKHILSRTEEALLAKASDFSSSVQNIFSMYNEADIKFPNIQDDMGRTVELTKGRYINFLESKNRQVRKDAFNGLFSTYNNHRNTLASIYISNVKKHVFYKNARNFSSSLEASLFENNIPTKVYTQLIDTVGDYLPKMHQYIAIRKRALKLDTIDYYDLYTPIIDSIDTKTTYPQAKETVIKSLEVLGQEYTSLLKHAFNNNWIDVYENKGKRSGAYSWGTYSAHPYVLLNYSNTLKDMFTLTHEMGHALHSYYSNKNQAYINSNYTIFLAEVASTVNEALLMAYLKSTTTDQKMKLYLINYFMEQFRGTVFRQTMFAEFEKITHELVEAGESLTADKLCEIYYDLNVKYYGKSMAENDLIGIEWARIPHFYYNFYVYQYATGYSSAIALSQKILNNPSSVDFYFEFLKSGGSDYSMNILRNSGVDMGSQEPIASALDVFSSLVDEMDSIIE
ncbi:oligoendopeptidase F [Natranaerovirga hydrolytica]|uniref:Oligopeptidase F n=1 Tax=Natranaerovirga hydrolytica TaxID=680378 RepID=A0A4R1M7A4_9FIRM|nr:oligoendopeptidase F [Natranaerovirga hydrolytica]TCK86724.1 oligoendopeptidase F [Natranaerovirga hydrolytica]